jgi:predicted nucleic acid-binding Zn ribbon protein
VDIDGQIKLGHLLLNDRKCRSCGEIKNLIDGFYRTRKNRGPVPSSYSYECKECTIRRVVSNRMASKVLDKWEYPDW